MESKWCLHTYYIWYLIILLGLKENPSFKWNAVSINKLIFSWSCEHFHVETNDLLIWLEQVLKWFSLIVVSILIRNILIQLFNVYGLVDQYSFFWPLKSIEMLWHKLKLENYVFYIIAPKLRQQCSPWGTENLYCHPGSY